MPFQPPKRHVSSEELNRVLQKAERCVHAEQWQQAAMVYRTAIALAGDSLCSIPYLWVLFLKHSRAIFQRFFAQPALVCLGLDGLTLQSTLMVTRTHR